MVRRNPQEIKERLKEGGLTEFGKQKLERQLTTEENRQAQINADLGRRQELIRLGLREPTKEEQARSEIMGITPEQRSEAATEQKSAAAVEKQEIPIGKVNLDLPGGEAGLLEKVEQTGLGQAISTRKLLQDEDIQNLGEFTKRMKEQNLTPEQVTEDPAIQSFLRLDLNENDLKVLAAREAQVSFFSQLIEGIPIIGKANRKYIGIGNTPATRQDQLMEQLKLESGFLDDAISLEEVNKIEQNIENLASKIKLITLQSPELQSEPEQVNVIELEILGVRNKIPLAKAKFGAVR